MGSSARLVVFDDATRIETISDRPCVLVVGNFDGVHIGHQAVLRSVASEARVSGLAAAVLTFTPHPAAAVARVAPALLTTIGRRAALMDSVGIERVYVRKFDADFAAWPAERFVRDLVCAKLGARRVVVGSGFRFGAGRKGDIGLLGSLGEALGFATRTHGVVGDAAGAFSSTRVRLAVAAGELAEARRLLSRPHALSGVVVHGEKRGRTIGFPTANLGGVPEALPPDGVYVSVVTEIEGDAACQDKLERSARLLGGGITNVGLRPTVSGTQRTIETFLLDRSEDLYGAHLRVHLLARLRGEMRFPSLVELKAQIANDLLDARRVLSAFDSCADEGFVP
ncbi:MAG: bifunctional riboflavin kinase/FAD synthetase [Polyangiaceae bacterium]|jgi:riboflavin kinase/FMN adenylyltransferase